jgi:hypothetical protein
MQSIDPVSLARKILDLLKVGPGSEIELSLTRGGQVLISKTEE